jgi:LPXTG-site transpeptidase (sortase) family protein
MPSKRWIGSVAGLCLGALLLSGCGRGASSSARFAAVATPAPVTVTPTPVPRHLPGRLTIPRIQVDAPIESVAVDRNGNMDVPSKPTNVAWYAPGPAPGEQGDAVIDGHLDWTTGPAVFWNLAKLRAGDEIDVTSQDGRLLRFRVTDLQSVAYNSHPTGLFAPTGPSRLSLITCAGAWDAGTRNYAQRLIVNASLDTAS